MTQDEILRWAVGGGLVALIGGIVEVIRRLRRGPKEDHKLDADILDTIEQVAGRMVERADLRFEKAEARVGVIEERLRGTEERLRLTEERLRDAAERAERLSTIANDADHYITNLHDRWDELRERPVPPFWRWRTNPKYDPPPQRALPEAP